MVCRNCGSNDLVFDSIDYVEEYTDLKGNTETVEIWNYMCQDCFTLNEERGR